MFEAEEEEEAEEEVVEEASEWIRVEPTDAWVACAEAMLEAVSDEEDEPKSDCVAPLRVSAVRTESWAMFETPMPPEVASVPPPALVTRLDRALCSPAIPACAAVDVVEEPVVPRERIDPPVELEPEDDPKAWETRLDLLSSWVWAAVATFCCVGDSAA